MILRARSVAARAPIREAQPGPGLRTATVRHQLDPHLEPWISVELFHMTEERRAGRQITGQCVITYLFEDSQGALICHGEDGPCRIGPGELHWLGAGDGAALAAEPEHPGVELHGVRMRIDLGAEASVPPRSLALSARDIPEVSAAGTRVRVLAGRAQGARSPLDDHHEALTILDVHLDPGAELHHVAPAGHRAWAMAIVGDGTAGPVGAERRLEHASAIAFADDGDAIRLRGNGAGLHAIVAHAARGRRSQSS